jgi:hypothetical protein
VSAEEVTTQQQKQLGQNYSVDGEFQKTLSKTKMTDTKTTTTTTEGGREVDERQPREEEEEEEETPFQISTNNQP